MAQPPQLWRTGDRVLDLSRRGEIMGIVNATPDSFSDGGAFSRPGDAIGHGLRLRDEGAAILDVGGESTRPGAPPVDTDEELRRVIPVIAGLRERAPGLLLSIDTMKARVAREALEAGADIVNDVTGCLGDPGMAGVVAGSSCGLVVMHMQGRPRTMQDDPRYRDVVAEVSDFLAERCADLHRAGVSLDRMVFDPGIGFGKTVAHNLALLNRLSDLAPCGRPLLLGVSRKSFMGTILGSADLADREAPTTALTAWARDAGVGVFRVHEAKPNMHALRMTEAIRNG